MRDFTMSMLAFFAGAIISVPRTVLAADTSSLAFLSRGGDCVSLGRVAATAVWIKLADAGNTKKGKAPSIEPHRFLAFAIGDDLEARGWSTDEILIFTKAIQDGGPYGTEEREATAALYYFREACVLAQSGGAPKPYQSLTSQISDCLDGKAAGYTVEDRQFCIVEVIK